jgi:hypothetical protein
MLTKNLYESSGVAAQFIFSIMNREFDIAAMCANEFIQSGCDELLQKLLVFVWMLCDPNNSYEKSFYTLYLSHNSKGFIECLFNYLEQTDDLREVPDIARKPGIFTCVPPTHDCSPTDYELQWFYKPQGWTNVQCRLFENSVRNSLARKQFDRAYRLSAQLLDSNKIALEHFLKSLGLNRHFTELLTLSVYGPMTHRILMHSYSILTCDAAISMENHNAMNAWRSSGRCFAISGSALEKWHVRSKPLERLCGSPVLVAEEDVCPYLEKACKSHGVRIVSENKELYIETQEEEFYKKYFPNDIPDEWSENEKKKSHGIEVHTTGEKNPWQVSFLLCWA